MTINSGELTSINQNISAFYKEISMEQKEEYKEYIGYNQTGSLLEDGTFSNERWYAVNQILSSSVSNDKAQSLFQHPTMQPQILPPPPVSSRSQPSRPNPDTSDAETESSTLNPMMYEKNICANIGKKIVQSFLNSSNRSYITRLCRKHGCSFQQAQIYYQDKVKGVFGLEYIYKLLKSEEGEAIKKVFADFMRSFLRKNYLIYMLRFGKMENREKYIEYKNKYLLYIEDVILSSIQTDQL